MGADLAGWLHEGAATPPWPISPASLGTARLILGMQLIKSRRADPHRRQEQADADGGGLHDVEVDRVLMPWLRRSEKHHGDLPIERNRWNCVASYAQKRTAPRPHGDATRRAPLEHADAGAAGDANGRERSDRGTTKAGADEG